MDKLLDWDKFAAIYAQNFSTTMGAKGIDARISRYALIIRYIETKDDIGTIEAIKENPYMRYFLGFDYFSSEPVFDPSLFVHIGKRLGNEDFDKMNQIIIAKALNLNPKENNSNKEQDNNDFTDEKSTEGLKNKGKLQMDATIADARIKFPMALICLSVR